MTNPASTQRWRTLVLLYPVMNARVGSGLSKRRAQRVMSREERAAVTTVVERLPATVLEWSDSAATLDPFDIVEVRRPIGSMSSVGGDRWWVGPREVRSELADVAATGARYDSVIVLWPGDPAIEQCGWGCTIGPGDATFGAGFSSISTDHWATLATDPDPEQGYVHEWLHQVEAVYRAVGLSEADLPSLHDAGAFTSGRAIDEPPFGASYAAHHDGFGGRAGARTWAPWYRDWMTGQLRAVAAAGGIGVDLISSTSTSATAAPASTASTSAISSTSGTSATSSASPIGLTPDRWALRGRA